MGRGVGVGSRAIVALHGFLGSAADWDAVRAAASGPEWIVPEYARDPRLSPVNATLDSWGGNFVDWLRREGIDGPVDLVGYSQGGRLALHALAASPASFRRVILVSANPGLPEDERGRRLANDEAWARRFENDSWEETVAAWNAQPVFAGGAAEPARPESAAARATAAASLRCWSLARQRDFRPSMRAWTDKLLLVAGARDAKYAETTKALAAEGLRTEILEGSGHRVLFDEPVGLARLILSPRGPA